MAKKDRKIVVSSEFLRNFDGLPEEFKDEAIRVIQKLTSGLKEGKSPEELGSKKIPESEIDNLKMAIVEAEGSIEIDSVEEIKTLAKRLKKNETKRDK